MQTDKFRMFLRQKNRKTTNLRLHNEQMVNDFRKITWASVFRLKRRPMRLRLPGKSVNPIQEIYVLQYLKGLCHQIRKA